MKALPLIVAISSLSLAGLASGAEAKANWDEHCAKCHGAEGKGDTKMGKKLSIGDFSDAAVQAKFTDEAGFNAVKVGIKDKNGKVTMKAIEGLSDDEIKALVAHVRTFKK